MTPSQPRTSSAKRAPTQHAGWIRRLRPRRPLGEENPDRSSSSGVPKAPPASTTARRARSSYGRPEPSPDARRGWARRFGATPSPNARERDGPLALEHDPVGLYARPDPSACGDGPRQVGDVSGPLGVQPAALRAGAALGAAPSVSRQRVVADAKGVGALHAGAGRFGPSARGPPAPRTASPRPRRSRGPARWSTRCRAHRASAPSTSSGARKQVPELITVVPPTARPTGVGIAGRPSAMVRPPSR